MKRFLKILIVLFLFSNFFFINESSATLFDSIFTPGAGTLINKKFSEPYLMSGGGIVNISGKEGYLSVIIMINPGDSPIEKITSVLHGYGAKPILGTLVRLSGEGKCFDLTGNSWSKEDKPTLYYNNKSEPMPSLNSLLNSIRTWNDVKTSWMSFFSI
jgi:hypothetical protein